MSNLIQGATSIVKSANDFENIKTNNPSNISNYLVSIYPNPNNGSFKIVINSQVSAMMFMDIYNELGIRIYQSIIHINNGYSNCIIDQANLPNGLYFINLHDGKINCTKKFQILK